MSGPYSLYSYCHHVLFVVDYNRCIFAFRFIPSNSPFRPGLAACRGTLAYTAVKVLPYILRNAFVYGLSIDAVRSFPSIATMRTGRMQGCTYEAANQVPKLIPIDSVNKPSGGGCGAKACTKTGDSRCLSHAMLCCTMLWNMSLRAIQSSNIGTLNTPKRLQML